jgi:hypothetical protein
MKEMEINKRNPLMLKEKLRKTKLKIKSMIELTCRRPRMQLM